MLIGLLSWVGVVLLSTNESLNPSRWSVAGWLLRHTRRLVPVLAVTIVARIVGQLLGVGLFVLAAVFLLRTFAGEVSDAAPWLWALVGVALLKALLRYVEHYAGHWVAFTSLQRLRVLFFDSLVPQAPAATKGRAGAELTERGVRDIDRIEVFFAHTFPPAISAVVVPLVSLICLGVWVSAPLAWVLAPFVLVILVVPLLTANASHRAQLAAAGARSIVAENLGDDFQGTREVLAFGAKQQRLQQLADADVELERCASRLGKLQALRTGTIVAAQLLGLVAVVLVAASGAGVSFGVDAAVVAIAVGVGLWVPAKGVDGFAASLDASFAAAARIREVIEAEPRVRDLAVSDQALADSSLRFDGVSYGYDASGTLDEVSFTAPAGQWSYLLGVSGSGKSTAASLVLRSDDPSSGTVFVGGVDARDLPLDQLRSVVGFVPQRGLVLSGSLADNLRLAAPDAADEALREAISICELDDFVAGLPGGLAGVLRERGTSISGGQLQRLMLARALVARPQVLILDEALSQLDGATAAAVRTNLRTARPDLTVLEITHRADLVPDAANVVILDTGVVAASGNAGELRRNSPIFAQLESRVG